MVKLIYVPGMKRSIRVATWKEAKSIVERTIKKNKKFLDTLADL